MLFSKAAPPVGDEHGSVMEFVKLNSRSPEFHEAYEVISFDIAPEFVEPEDAIHERLRIQDEGARTEKEKRTIPEGYRVHMTAAKDGKTHRLAGAVYSTFIPKIGSRNLGFSLVTYISVRREYRRQGIATDLVKNAAAHAYADALRITGKHAVGLLFEIDDEGKTAAEGLVQKMGGYPLDIDYWQPPVREGCSEQPMNLWMVPLDQTIRSRVEADEMKYPAGYIHDMVRSLFQYEYPGPDRTGFQENSKPYQALLHSLENRRLIGFKKR